MPAAYFRSFADKLIASFLPRFTTNIFKCKNVNDLGAQQLLLDTHAIKTIFTKMPHIGLTPEKAQDLQMSPSYNKNIGVEITKSENILKMVGTPADRLVDRLVIVILILIIFFCVYFLKKTYFINMLLNI